MSEDRDHKGHGEDQVRHASVTLPGAEAKAIAGEINVRTGVPQAKGFANVIRRTDKEHADRAFEWLGEQEVHVLALLKRGTGNAKKYGYKGPLADEAIAVLAENILAHRAKRAERKHRWWLAAVSAGSAIVGIILGKLL